MAAKGDVISIRGHEYIVCSVAYGRKWITLDLADAKTKKLATFKHKVNVPDPFTIVRQEVNKAVKPAEAHKRIATQRRERSDKRRDNWHKILDRDRSIIHSGKNLYVVIRFTHGKQAKPLFKITDSGCYYIAGDHRSHYVSGRFVEGFEAD